MSNVPVPSFDAYELRTYEVSPATLGSISVSERFLIGVPRPMIDKIRKEPLFADATEADATPFVWTFANLAPATGAPGPLDPNQLACYQSPP
jgi:hypothetical protein